MGMGKHLIEAIVREHRHKPIAGDVLLIGRQTVYLSPDELVRTIREHGVSLQVDPSSIEVDQTTLDRRLGYAERLVNDAAFFKLLGARSVKALDHSPYEGADVIHDLRYPIPDHLQGIADFIVDGSTLDNVFTPSIVLQNYAKLLRPGGRLLMENAFSAHNTAYAMMPPMWYLDYFVMNKFVDCKVYIVMFLEDKIRTMVDNVFWVDLDQVSVMRRRMHRFVSPYQMVTIVFAEKGENSTVDRLPNQQDYRSADEWSEYLANLDVIRQSERHHLVRSRTERVFEPSIPGHPFIDGEFCVQVGVSPEAAP
jgi:nicotinamide mononucleotide adenylyltransferase